jgi:DNA-binding transcriptional regulator YhcF (GntR family)
MSIISINPKGITPIYEQIRESIISAIGKGILKEDDRIPSINGLCRQHGISPGTVIKAYDELCRSGILGSKKGKGYYVISTRIPRQLNIFVLFDRMSAYKEVLYESFHHHIGPEASVQVFFHHYDHERFRSMIEESVGRYNFYVIMPHFNHDVSEILRKVPDDKLLIIDKTVPALKGRYASICQNFREDIYKSLNDGIRLVKKYRRVFFVRSTSRFQFVPDGLIRGFEKFIHDNSLTGSIIPTVDQKELVINTLYIVFPDSDLIWLIKEAKKRHWKIGKDIGIIAYDDSPMKEILEGGISVISTDFASMGAKAAELILSGRKEKLFNPCSLIKRKSL